MFNASTTRRSLLTSALALPALAVSGTRGFAQAALPLRVSLNAPYDGSNAAFFLAEEKGYYRDAGLAPQFDPSGGSGEAVTRIGSNVYDFGFADLNVLMEFNQKNPGQAGRSVYMLYYRSPLCVAYLAKTPITKPSDLAGRKIGAAAPDGAYRLFPAYVAKTGLVAKDIVWDMVGLQLREAVLSRGDVEAILGFDSTMYFGLQKAGVKAEDIKFLYYSDVGLDLYGNSIVASKKILETNPEAVRKFVAATARGWQDAIANPDAAIAALKKRAELTNVAIETEKLKWLIKNQVVTDESRKSGLGVVSPERLAASIATVAPAYGLPTIPNPSDIFDASYLPEEAIRRLPI